MRREISRYLHDRFDLPYGPDEILVTVGGSEAIDICMRAMLDPGDEVILPEPCFVSYLPCVRMAGGTPVRISLEEKDEFKLTGKKLKEAITDQNKDSCNAISKQSDGSNYDGRGVTGYF